MVLRPNNSAKRVNENIPPSRTLNQKALVSRLQSTLHSSSGFGSSSNSNVPNRIKKTRNSGGMSHSAKYAVERSKRRNNVKTKLRFHIKTVAKSTDVEMADGCTPVAPIIQARPILLPQELPRPMYTEINPDVLGSVASDLVASDIAEANHEYLREHLALLGTDLMQSLSSIKINNITNKLPREMVATVNEKTEILPSHILAIFGKPPSPESTKSRQVTLYPVHTLVLALHCAHLPTPPPMLPVPTVPLNPREPQPVTLPVFSICIPSPETYPQLSQYLYTKRISHLTRGLLPSTPPQSFLEKPEQAEAYAASLAATFTPQVIVKHVQMMHGFWQNVCALGVFDDALWQVMDVVWKVLLRALGHSTGEPILVHLGPAVPAEEGTESQESASSSSVVDTDASSHSLETSESSASVNSTTA